MSIHHFSSAVTQGPPALLFRSFPAAFLAAVLAGCGPSEPAAEADARDLAEARRAIEQIRNDRGMSPRVKQDLIESIRRQAKDLTGEDVEVPSAP